jgi:hypothetical protein
MSMLNQGRQFDDATIRLLRRCGGRELLSYEGFSPFGDERHIYKTVRLHFDGGLVIDLVNAHEPIVVGAEYAEEQFAILSASESDGHAIWTPPEKRVFAEPVGLQVNDVLVVVDTMLLSKGSRRLNQIKLAQAVLFEDEDGGLLAFDRDIWSDEYLSIREGAKVSETTRDFRPDFVAEPPYSYQFKREILRLSNPHV